MSFVAVAVGGGALVGGIGGAIINSNAAGNAADIQSAAANKALDLDSSMFGTIQGDISPYLQAGSSAVGQLGTMASQPVSFTQQDFLNNQDPAYGFDMQQGTQAVQRSAAAAGGLQSGGTLTALNNYAQGMASNEYSNAYNRFMNNQNTQFSRLQSVAGMGQTATGQLAGAAGNYMDQSGNMITGSANAQAAGTIGSANALSSGLSSLTSGVGAFAGLGGLSGGFGSAGYTPAGAANPSMGGTYGAGALTAPQLGSQFAPGGPSLLTSYSGS